MSDQTLVVKEAPKAARKQVTQPVTGNAPQDTGEYNIWHHRRMTPRATKTHQVSKYRCIIALDAGWTRGETARCSYCCMYFARGICHKGKDCEYLHQLPTEYHEQLLTADHTVDMFGRDKLPGSHTGTKGVGSYDRESKTLYVNYGGAGHLGPAVIRQLLETNFEEWGPIERIYNVPSKTIAFVQYYWRASAEFAKEAMQNQHLRGSDMASSESLDVRWANDDPNPKAVARVKRNYEEEYMNAVRHAVNELPPEQKRARLLEMQLYGNVQRGSAVAPYPDTNRQYADAAELDPAAAVAPYPDTSQQYQSAGLQPALLAAPGLQDQELPMGFLEDPQAIIEAEQYAEDQRNIDMLLYDDTGQDDTPHPATVPEHSSRQAPDREQSSLLAKVDKTENAVSGLVQYSSSDEDVA